MAFLYLCNCFQPASRASRHVRLGHIYTGLFDTHHLLERRIFSVIMLPPIPIPADYGVSPDSGFLPSEPPLEQLPDPYYSKWEWIASNIQGLLLSRRIRGVVDTMPLLSTSYLQTEPEWRRAYSILGFILHGYVWAGPMPAEVCCVIQFMHYHLTTVLTKPENPISADRPPLPSL